MASIPSAPKLAAGFSAGGPFATEADMLAPLLHGFAPDNETDWDCVFEVQTLQGVVDVLYVDIDREALSERQTSGLGPLHSPSEVSVINALQTLRGAESRPVPTEVIAGLVTVGDKHLRSAVLPGLAANGWIERSSKGWSFIGIRAPVVRQMVAVEVKRSDWRRALSQATSYAAFADSTYVALDDARARDLVARRPAFDFAGVGLLTVAATGGVWEHISPRRRPRPDYLHRVVAERVINLISGGYRSGAVRHVFGRALTTSAGMDPRFPEAD